MSEIEISREAAYLILRLLEEFYALDARAGCSDRYFRQHFMSMVRAAMASGTLDQLRQRLAQ